MRAIGGQCPPYKILRITVFAVVGIRASKVRLCLPHLAIGGLRPTEKNTDN